MRRILEAYEISYDRVEVPSWDRRQLARLSEGNYYQVPIIDHDGKIIHKTAADSLAVAHHLDQSLVDGCLFPDHCAGIQEIVTSHIELSKALASA